MEHAVMQARFSCSVRQLHQNHGQGARHAGQGRCTVGSCVRHAMLCSAPSRPHLELHVAQTPVCRQLRAALDLVGRERDAWREEGRARLHLATWHTWHASKQCTADSHSGMCVSRLAGCRHAAHAPVTEACGNLAARKRDVPPMPQPTSSTCAGTAQPLRVGWFSPPAPTAS